VIAFTCTRCAKKFSVGDDYAGRRTKCPKCNTVLHVPVPQIATAKPVARTAPSARPVTPAPPSAEVGVPKLMGCASCGQQIAFSAAACPKCGAPNNWVHPEIERFRNSLDAFGDMPPFNIKWERFVLRGTAKVKRGAHATDDVGVKGLAGGFLCMLVGAFLPGDLGVVVPWVLGPLGVFGGSVLMLVSTFQKTNNTDFVVSFAIDFSESPPKWQSDDNEFWKDVRRFFTHRRGLRSHTCDI
jgi:predicted RNA-binding Zn-ribbon protein involved in translation (DUF1610 family)